jgi:hypothetical protein
MLVHKKLFFGLLLASAHSFVYSYTISIKNETIYAIKVTLVYAGGSIICPNVEFEIKKGETHNTESGACCTSEVKMLALEGPMKGQSFTYDPPVTGFGIACRSFSFVIKKTEDNKFIGVSI